MKRQGWLIAGKGEETRIYEARLDELEWRSDQLRSYEEAKAEALRRLREQVEPLLEAISMLLTDDYAEAGKLPQVKAWRNRREDCIVIAKTKRRTMEITRESRYSFTDDWTQCQGDWWWGIPLEEGVWVAEKDGQEFTGNYFRCLGRDGARELAEQHMQKYREMPVEELVALDGLSATETGVDSHGTPYRINTTVRVRETKVKIEVKVDDRLGRDGYWWADCSRMLPQPETVDWVAEGF